MLETLTKQQRKAQKAQAKLEKAISKSSFFKYYGTELAMQKEELRLEVNGFNSTEWTSEESNNGREARYFNRSKGHSIEGGTHEVQLNIIAKRVLGLPSK